VRIGALPRLRGTAAALLIVGGLVGAASTPAGAEPLSLWGADVSSL
jgi:hypothetical protein